MKRNHELKTLDAWASAWTQAARSPRLPRAWKRRLSALIDGFKAWFWTFS